MRQFENNLEERDNELNKQMAAHPAEESIQVLVKDARRRLLQLRLLTAVVVINILLIIGLGIVSYKTNEVVQLAQSNKAAVVANCETANDSRRNNRALWDFAFSLSPDEPRTPEQEARVTEFRVFVNKTFAERDCQSEINKPTK